MKTQFILLSLLISFFVAKINAQSALTGKIINAKGLELNYIPPLHGNFFLSGYSEIKIDTAGRFTADVMIDTTSLVSFYCNRSYWRMLLNPGDKDSVFIDALKPLEIQFFGKNAAINTFLNQKLKREKYFAGLNDTPAERALIDEFNGSIIEKKIKILRDSEMVVTKRYFAQNETDTVRKKIIWNDIKYYHVSLFNSLTISAIKMENKTKEDFFDTDWQNSWTRIIDSTLISNDDALASYWYHDVADKYIDWYRVNFKKEVDMSKLDLQRGDNIFENEQLIRKYFTGRALEAVLANMILDEAAQERYQPVLVSVYNRFQKDFPNSLYLRYLYRFISPINNKLSAKLEDLEVIGETYILDNPDIFTTFDQFGSMFKNKVVYVDLWATWCGPCKEEFKFKYDLEKFLKGKNVEKLYISLDKKDKEKTWNDMISLYGLSGTHVRASVELLQDIRNRFFPDSPNGISIPRYIIIGADGKVAVPDAKRPSEREKLYREIEDTIYKKEEPKETPKEEIGVKN